MSFPSGVVMQFFHWYSPGGVVWNDLAREAAQLAASGFTSVWIPPAYKGAGGTNDVGYGVYDLFDLGEFRQKQTIATKYGSKQELLAAIRAAQAAGLQVYADVVFNQKDGADQTEDVWAQEVHWNDRNRVLGDWYRIKAWTRFEFPGRGNTYSRMKWFWWCFDAVSYDQNHPAQGNDKLFRSRTRLSRRRSASSVATTTISAAPTASSPGSSRGSSPTGASGSCGRRRWTASGSTR